jgi:hypothetical protein
MALLEISSTKQLIAVRSVIFFVLLFFIAWNLIFELNNSIILPILTITQLRIENILEIV